MVQVGDVRPGDRSTMVSCRALCRLMMRVTDMSPFVCQLQTDNRRVPILQALDRLSGKERAVFGILGEF